MAETLSDRKIFSLLEVTKSIQKTLSERYKNSFWVKAEMNKLNYYRQSGHCYPELVEKQNGKIIAQIKSCLWKDDYLRADSKFRAVLKEPLKDGIKILFLARITFDPSHGLSLSILDIDPSYTLGDLEREKQETIQRLREEGIFERNKALKLPALPQRVAIISVETSKGLADFTKVIETNPWHYKFFGFLFPSLLQGDKAVASISYQLKRIKKVKDHFDVVAIIRGGGGDVGLSCYNNYALAKEIAMFPLPVITGIGHATNETVTEMISFYNAITPTKLAEYLLQTFHNFSVPVKEAEKKIHDLSRRIISQENKRFQSEIKLFRSVTENILAINKNDIRSLAKSVLQSANYIFKNRRDGLVSVKASLTRATNTFCKAKKFEIRQVANNIPKDVNAQMVDFQITLSQLNHRLQFHTLQLFRSKTAELNNLEKNINNMSPENVLKRGYSITLHNGKSIRNVADMSEGDLLETLVAGGKIVSTVKSSSKKENE
ncbi:exodeoxyribonuclease VII large subunit [Chryseosolibacter indicus]|uniref:Exodeoxyribonuclease 7 large subunit n=1 Tax=Chryseosolibacter indicus TaxID=2782351 RepID=A0ABS5VKL5_9BACT|nr:exodeoxyribonuclease VII large subunit [Chryseosolibacter indicus]MBT1701916.1 exodeoxyribonuclease VII large subunit [Chryseosolibacter indicus]